MIYSPAAQNMTPRSVVDAIANLLSRSGDLKGDDEAVSLLDHMREATMLFQRAIYLCVLKNTRSEKILNTYLSKGGWDLLNSWLTEAKKSGNSAIALEILEVLNHIPVTLTLLKQGNMGKVVKGFTKIDDKDGKDLKKTATELLDRWMKLVRDKDSSKKKKTHDEDVVSKKELLVPKKGSSKSAPLAESGGFLDAISSSSSKSTAPRKIRKRSSTDAEYKRSNSNSEMNSSFNEDSVSNTSSSSAAFITSKPSKSKQDKAQAPISPAAGAAPATPAPNRLLLSNSPPPLPEKSHGNDNMFCFKRAKKRRRIRWREELEDVQIFECDDSDRAAHKSFADSMMKECERERMAVMRSRQLGDDMMVEMVNWRHPLKLEGDCLTLAEKGSSSKERAIQREREKNVLAVLIFDTTAMPESAQEPDPEELIYQYMTPKIIPLADDQTMCSPPQPIPHMEDNRREVATISSPDSQQLPPVLASMLPTQDTTVPHNNTVMDPPAVPHNSMVIGEMLPHPGENTPPTIQTQYEVQYTPMSGPIPLQRYGQTQYTVAPEYKPPPTRGVQYAAHFPGGPERYDKSRNGGGWNYKSTGRNYKDWYEDRDERGDRVRGRPPTGRKHCHFFSTPQGCRSGDKCGYIHDKNAVGPFVPSNNRSNSRWSDERIPHRNSKSDSDHSDRDRSNSKEKDIKPENPKNSEKTENMSEENKLIDTHS